MNLVVAGDANTSTGNTATRSLCLRLPLLLLLTPLRTHPAQSQLEVVSKLQVQTNDPRYGLTKHATRHPIDQQVRILS